MLATVEQVVNFTMTQEQKQRQKTESRQSASVIEEKTDIDSANNNNNNSIDLKSSELGEPPSSPEDGEGRGEDGHGGSIHPSPGTGNGNSPFPMCGICGKTFANSSNLKHHINSIHLNEARWICSQCGKVCTSKSNLKVHLRVHLRIKPYHCKYCPYNCMHHSSIRDHLNKCHPDKVHNAIEPGYYFNSNAVPEPEVFNSKDFDVAAYANNNSSTPAHGSAGSASYKDPSGGSNADSASAISGSESPTNANLDSSSKRSGTPVNPTAKRIKPDENMNQLLSQQQLYLKLMQQHPQSMGLMGGFGPTSVHPAWATQMNLLMMNMQMPMPFGPLFGQVPQMQSSPIGSYGKKNGELVHGNHEADSASHGRKDKPSPSTDSDSSLASSKVQRLENLVSNLKQTVRSASPCDRRLSDDDNELSPRSEHRSVEVQVNLLVDATNRVDDDRKEFRCAYCNIVFFDILLYGSHMGMHDSENPWQCNVCKFKCKDRYEFTKHILHLPDMRQ